MAKTFQKGLIVASEEMHAKIEANCPRAYEVTSWQHGRSPKTQLRLYAEARAAGNYTESVFDAVHGFRYLLFIYADREGRKACWDHLTGGVQS